MHCDPTRLAGQPPCSGISEYPISRVGSGRRVCGYCGLGPTRAHPHVIRSLCFRSYRRHFWDHLFSAAPVFVLSICYKYVLPLHPQKPCLSIIFAISVISVNLRDRLYFTCWITNFFGGHRDWWNDQNAMCYLSKCVIPYQIWGLAYCAWKMFRNIIWPDSTWPTHTKPYQTRPNFSEKLEHLYWFSGKVLNVWLCVLPWNIKWEIIHFETHVQCLVDGCHRCIFHAWRIFSLFLKPPGHTECPC